MYNEYWQSDKAMLLYPGNATSFEDDFKDFEALKGKDKHHACGLGRVCIFKVGSSVLDEGIGRGILGSFEL